MAIVIEADTCAAVWEKSISYLLKHGEYVPSIHGPVLECSNTALSIINPWNEPRISPLSPLFSKAESFGSSLRNHPRIANWDGIDQIDYVIQTLRDDPLSRRAVVSVWNPPQDRLLENAQGVISLIFLIRGDRLHLTSIFRTTDAWMCNWTLTGVPELQRIVYNKLHELTIFRNLGLGTYTQFHSSFHMYLDDVKNAEIKLGVFTR